VYVLYPFYEVHSDYLNTVSIHIATGIEIIWCVVA